MNISFFKNHISESIKVKQNLMNDDEMMKKIQLAVEYITSSYSKGGKVLLCGNGGSAADAQHIAAELSGRYFYDRPPLYAEALHVNTSYITAVANDYSFDYIYSRMIDAAGKKGDVFIAFSTSGNSKNVIRAARSAFDKGMKIISFTGESGGKLKEISDILINIPSSCTPIIQESHIMIGHIICEWVEKEIFPKNG